MSKFFLENVILRSPEGGGGEAAPAPEPSGEAVPSESVPGNDDFSGLDFGGDDLDTVETIDPPGAEPGVSSQTTEPPKAPETPKEPPAPEAAPSPKKEEPKVPEQEQQAAKPQGQQEEPKSPPSEPQDPFVQFEQDKPKIIEGLATKRYALSKEDLDLLEAEPGKALPLLAARVHVELFQDMLKSVTGMLPVAINQHLETHQANNAAVEAFKTAWPQLDLEKYGEDIAAFSQVFRQTNPKASREEAIKMVGAMVMAKHGLAASQQPASPAPAQQVAPQAAPPFRPAQPGVVQPPAPVAVEEFAGLGQDFD